MKSSLNPLAAAFPATGSSEDLTKWSERFSRSASDYALDDSHTSSQAAMSPISPAAALLPDDPFGMANTEGATRLQRKLSRQPLTAPRRGSFEVTGKIRRQASTPVTVAANTRHASSTSTTDLSIAEPSGDQAVSPDATNPSLGPILEAARSGFLTPLVASAEEPINPHATDAHGRPALYLVADMEHGPRTLDLLLQHGAQIEATDPNGNTPLMLAVKNNQMKAAVNLLLRHANPNTTDAEGKSALEMAENNDNRRLADVLLRFGATAPADAPDVRSNLLAALNNRQIDDVFRLACMFEGKNELHPDGRTAIHLAAAQGDMEMLTVLLAAGFRPNIVDRMGNTPMHLSAAAGMENAVQFLVARGGHVITRNNEGLTPQDLLQARAQANSPVVVHFNPNPQYSAGSPRQ